MKPQKYRTEISLAMCSQGTAVLRPSEITEALANLLKLDFLDNCHIYAIGRRPRVSFEPNSLSHDGTSLHGILCFHQQGKVSRKNFSTYVKIKEPIAKFEISDYPHSSILGVSLSGEVITSSPLALIAPLLMGDFTELLDVEIVYIGQAFGKKGGRHALNRLASHSTLQKIQADILTNDPDSEILLIVVEYDDPLAMLHIDGANNPILSEEEDDIHRDQILRKPISDADLTTITEAGLIRYFRPHYNSIYKSGFPDSRTKSLQDCYKLDFAGLSVEIDTSDLHFRIFSSYTQRNFHHIAMYDLHTEENRRTFFGQYGLKSVKRSNKSGK